MAEQNTDDNETVVQTPEELAAATKKAEEAAEQARVKAEADAEATKKTTSGTNKTDTDMINKLVQDRLDEQLAAIKKSLDGAYKQRDEGLAKIAAFEAREKEANIKRLQEEGKHKEAWEMQLSEERAKNAALIQRNTELSRDVAVRDALRGYQFRNDKASNMAFKEITAQLVQNEQNEWIHRSGISVKDYCEAFSRDEEQSFLFKPKANSGGGSTTVGSNPVPVDTKPKSIFEYSQADVLKMAAEGKLDKSKKR